MCPYYLMFIEMIDWKSHSIVSWPIKKLLVQINQSSYLISFCHNFFNRAKETNMYEIKSWRIRSQIPYADTDLFCFSSIIFKNITVLLKKQLFRKKCYSWGKTTLNWYGWNLENSRTLVFIIEACVNLIVVSDGGKLMSQKKSDVLQSPVDVCSFTNVVGENISLVTLWNIYFESVR